MQQNKLFVGNLPFSANENDLQIAFEQFGEIDEIRVIIDRETGRSRGFCLCHLCRQGRCRFRPEHGRQRIEWPKHAR